MDEFSVHDKSGKKIGTIRETDPELPSVVIGIIAAALLVIPILILVCLLPLLPWVAVIIEPEMIIPVLLLTLPSLIAIVRYAKKVYKRGIQSFKKCWLTMCTYAALLSSPVLALCGGIVQSTTLGSADLLGNFFAAFFAILIYGFVIEFLFALAPALIVTIVISQVLKRRKRDDEI